MRRFETRDGRFSNRVLQNFSALGLPETLAVRAAAADAPAEILLYDEIGFWGVTAKDFVMALLAAGDGPITLRINSPGGDVFDGLAIYNALLARKAPVNVVIEGLAASAASFIALAGTTVSMAEQSMMMIHKAWGFTIGNDDDHLEQAVTLGKIDGQLANIYARKTGKPAADMLALMKAESWFTADEAKAGGLCDSIITPPAKVDAKAMASFTQIVNAASPVRADVVVIDPDGDGDDDGADAITLIQAAMGNLTDAIEALNGTDDDMEAAAKASAEIAAAATAAAAPTSANDAVADASRLARLNRLRLATAEAA